MLDSWSMDGSVLISTKPDDGRFKLNSEGQNSNTEGGKNKFSRPSNCGVWCTYCKNCIIQKRLLGNFIGNHKILVRMVASRVDKNKVKQA